MDSLTGDLMNDKWIAENLVEAMHTAVAISSGYVLYLWIPILFEAWIKKERGDWFYTLMAFMIIKASTFYNYAPLSLSYWMELDHGFLASPFLMFLSVTRQAMHLLASAILISRAWHAYNNKGMWWYFWRWSIGIACLVLLLTLFGTPPWDPPNIWHHPLMPWEHEK
jgi:hypothetical protein